MRLRNVLLVLSKDLVYTSLNSTWLSYVNSLTRAFRLNNLWLPFWKLFKNLFTRKLGLLTTNISKTSSYNLIRYLQTRIRLDATSTYTAPQQMSAYLAPIAIIPFGFQRTTYNTSIFLILSLLSRSYVVLPPRFNLLYGYILRPTSFGVYNFVNLFYFRLHNH